MRAAILGIGVILLAGTLSTAAARPINGRELRQPVPGAAYAFWIVGHSYGRSVYPASSLLANLDRINRSGALGLILLGDALRYPTPFHVDILRRVVDSIEMPVFLAPGNHELRDPGTYEAVFGPTYYDFRLRGDQYLVFEASLYHGGMRPEQLAWLVERLGAAGADPQVTNVVVLSHQLAWAVDDPRLLAVRSQLNFPDDYRSGFFAREIAPAVEAVAAVKPVYWISGDRSGFPPFYWKVPELELRYAATGLKDDEDDAMLELYSSAEGEIELRLVSLAGRDLGPLEQYGPEYWDAHFEGGPRALLLRRPVDVRWIEIWLFVRNPRFLWGTAFGSGAVLGLAALVWLLLRRRLAG